MLDSVDALKMMFDDGVDSLWRTIKAMPADKLDWRPAEGTRTTREILEELVMTTPFSAELIHTMKVPEMAEQKYPQDIAELEKMYRASVDDFIKAVREFPEDKLQEKMDLPWGAMTFFQMITYPYWNLMYHWGQISYLQTMYGDKEMH